MQILEEGQKFKRYHILHRLGSSGSGTSYEAEDTLLQRKVTLKQIHPGTTFPDAARRQFFREMQDISAFTHPYLASVLDYGEVDGQLYIARRYVTPGSLLGSEGRFWFNPPLDVNDAVSYARQLAEALHSIHRNGYLHGALTFSNILVTAGPPPHKEADFAPFLISDVGTTHFVRRFAPPQSTFLPITAAPEQFGKRVTAASDQYALAVLLYFWLTARPPFLGTPDEIEHLKLTETITTLTALNLKVPLELEGVIRRALSVYPEDRYPSIQAFADALRASILHISQTSLTTFTPIESDALFLQNSVPTLEFLLPVRPPTSMPDQPDQPITPLAPEPSPQAIPDVPQPLPEPKQIPPEPTEEEATPTHPHETAPQNGALHFQASVIITSPYTPQSQEIILEQDEITLGRAGSSTILLDQDTLTSRHHALLKHVDNHYEIYDLKSANGTLINGHALPTETGYALNDGDHITIGEYELLFCLKQDSALLEQFLHHN
jgi:serine/threonine protein kinase